MSLAVVSRRSPGCTWQVWDSAKLHTCVCDTGYYGFDCSLRNCPRGDDPLTTDQVNEVQLVVCQVSKIALTGSVLFSFIKD